MVRGYERPATPFLTQLGCASEANSAMLWRRGRPLPIGAAASLFDGTMQTQGRMDAGMCYRGARIGQPEAMGRALSKQGGLRM